MDNRGSISNEAVLKLVYCAAVIVPVGSLFIPFMKTRELGNVSMASFYGTLSGDVGSLLSDLGMEGNLAGLKFALMYSIWVPVILLAAAAVMNFASKSVRVSFGINIAMAPMMLFQNISSMVLLGSIFGTIHEEGFLNDGESFSRLPFGLNIVASVVMLTMMVMLFIFESRYKKDSVPAPSPTPEPKPEPQPKPQPKPAPKKVYGTVRRKNGKLTGRYIDSPSIAKIESMVPVKIGRGAGSDIIIVDAFKSVSKQHCEIMYDGSKDKYYVTDISSYGTSIGDNTKLVKNMKTPVSKGTVLTLAGKEKIVLE